MLTRATSLALNENIPHIVVLVLFFTDSQIEIGALREMPLSLSTLCILSTHLEELLYLSMRERNVHTMFFYVHYNSAKPITADFDTQHKQCLVNSQHQQIETLLFLMFAIKPHSGRQRVNLQR